MRMAFWPVRSQMMAAEILVTGSLAFPGRLRPRSGGSSHFSTTTAEE